MSPGEVVPQLGMFIDAALDISRLVLFFNDPTFADLHRVIQGEPLADRSDHPPSAFTPVLAVILFPESSRSKAMGRSSDHLLALLLGHTPIKKQERPQLSLCRALRKP